MAEVTAMRNNALPYPVYGAPWTLVFPILDADGDLVTGATTPDAEVSKNGDTFADCTNESTEIATNSGMYYLTLTGTEMTADVVAVIAKSATSGAKTTPMVMYPRKLVTLRTGTAQGGEAGYITLDASAGAINDMWNGCLCVATIDSNVEARIITNYTGSNNQAEVTPNWNVTPDSDDTFTIYLPEGMQIPTALLSPGTGTGQISLSSGAVTAGTVSDKTGYALADDAITAAKIAADAGIEIGTAVWATASRTLTANTNLNDPTAAAIADAVWDEDRSGHTSAGSFGQGVASVQGNVTGSVDSVTGAVGSVTDQTTGSIWTD